MITEQLRNVSSFTGLVDLLMFAQNINKEQLLRELYIFFAGNDLNTSNKIDYTIPIRDNKLPGFKVMQIFFQYGNPYDVQGISFVGIEDMHDTKKYVTRKFDYYATNDQTSRDGVYFTVFTPKEQANFRYLEIESHEEIFEENEITLDEKSFCSLLIKF